MNKTKLQLQNNSKKTITARRLRRDSHPASLREELVPIPSSLEKIVKKHLNSSYYSFTKGEGETVEFQCNNIATKRFFREFPRSSRRWVLNNHPLKVEGDRMMFQLASLAIQSLKTKDQGVYLCRIDYEPRQSKTVGVFSLIVESETITIFVKELTPLRIQCNSGPIGYLFPTATRQWENKGKIMKSNIPAKDSTNDIFPSAEKSYAGNWLCSVKHKETGRIWKTASYRVFVDKPPTFTQRCVTYVKKNPVLIASLILGIVAFFFVVISGLVKKAAKEKGYDMLAVDKFKDHYMETHGGKDKFKLHDSDSYSGNHV